MQHATAISPTAFSLLREQGAGGSTLEVRVVVNPTPAPPSRARRQSKIAVCLIHLALLSSAIASEPDHPWIPAYRTDPESWRDITAGQAEQAKKGGIDLVFIGDSLTQGWEEQPLWKTTFEPLHAVNFGIGGDGPQHVLWRIEHGIVDFPTSDQSTIRNPQSAIVAPKAVVLMIGINNFWRHHSAEDTARGIETIVDRLHSKLPGSRILLLSLLPALDASDDIRPWTKAINQRLAKQQSTNNRVQYLDLYPDFLGANDELRTGCFMLDKLHLAPGGYALLARRLTAALKTAS